MVLLLRVLLPSPGAAGSFVNFESGQVRPLALSPDGSLLFATNTPDNRLAILAAGAKGLARIAEVPVGLEPVAVAVRENRAGTLDVWVVNHLSDSVSIVRVDPAAPERARVMGTLQVGDEPRDLVFGGRARPRAFVTTARRGQNLRPGLSARFDIQGVGRALVWAFDADDPFADTAYDADASPSPAAGEPLSIIELFGDSPRALALSPDGSRVYAAIFLSGNQTTLVGGPALQTAGLPPPPADSQFYPDNFPLTPLLVRRDLASGAWRDELARDWSSSLLLPPHDADVFTIDADAEPPALVSSATVSGVGTVLYAMAARPTDGTVFVANTEARNEIRFEPLIDATHGLRGRAVDNRITVIPSPAGAGALRPVGLNPHVDSTRPNGSGREMAGSLALPTALAFSADGRRLYATAFGSERIAILDSFALEAGVVSRATVTVGGGPSGLALDERRDRLYVLNRFDQTIAVVQSAARPTKARVASTTRLGFDPSPPAVTRGRRFLFDARLSGHGDLACASCHVFADFDGLAWDLGDPYGAIQANVNDPALPPWHPMKGPMVTMSLRGLAGAGPMHWRGDRTAAADGGSPFDSAGAFKQFNRAFVALLGGKRTLGVDELQGFADWALTVRYPPNPVARLDGVATPAESRGSALFNAPDKCSVCHALPLGTGGVSIDLVGSIKVPHLRNMYTKIGMMDQIRGFGFFHSGTNAILELPRALLGTPEAMLGVPDLDAYLLAFPTGLAPIVGQQVSATPATLSDPAALERRDLLVARADAGECDLVVHGALADGASGAFYLPASRSFVSDRTTVPAFTPPALWSQADTTDGAQVWTCVPPGSGARLGIDRDGDGALDGDERAADASPSDPVSRPGRAHPATIGVASLRMRGAGLERRRFRFTSRLRAPRAIVPRADSASDPTITGAMLRVYNAASSGEQLTVELPATAWRRGRSGYRYRSLATAISAVTIEPGRLSIAGGGALFGYTLDEPTQRRIVVRLTIGPAVDWCAEAVADGTRARDEPGRFVVRKARPADDCPAPPAG